ncbi:hypothetical protein GCK72_000988 [Caenorhabditis remanei]|uniref:C2H2-type domain-containing protein n=1 Tax=Caenorhabditis remanei TaxID=31234 RepID=A0A6A5HRC5_CAERE|nr:hypothetical protein GCK72_000988 [Caenorhabditis remanei]KAF1769174.1 hypothetical protein GCK72_000988 [Caenorhabditis remanei]
MATYIVIEVSEIDNALEIMNILMTHTTARFTITRNICEYAEERGKLERATTEKAENQKITEIEEPPLKKTKNTEEAKPITPPPPKELVIPKIEQADVFDFQNNLIDSWNSLQPPALQSTISELIKSSQSNGEMSQSLKTSNKRQNSTFQCQMCGAFIKAYHFDYYKRSNHAIIHTNLQRYVCPVSGCGSKTRHRSNMVVHAKAAHGLIGKVDVKNCLSPQEDEELKQMIVTCFPEMEGTIQKMLKKEKNKNGEALEEDGAVGSDDDFVEEIVYER